MRKGMIGTGIAIAALFGVATSSIAATVRAGDSLPKAGKRVAVRAGGAQDGTEAGAGAAAGGGGLTTTTLVIGGLAAIGTVGGIIALTSSESP